MDRRKLKFDWNKARAFWVTAEEGSLSAAARSLGLTQPTLSRQVAALEQELGVVLFERVGQGLSLTPNGEALLEHVRIMGNAANNFSLASFGKSQVIKGKITIAASETYAAYILPPILLKLRQIAPNIDIEIIASNQASDLKRREADIAIRNFRPSEPDLVAKKIRDASALLYATPNYLKQIGNPCDINGLNDAQFINIEPNFIYMDSLNAAGFNLKAENFSILAENFLVNWQLVKNGLGIGMVDIRIGDKDATVDRVLKHMPAFKFPIWLVAHREIKNNARMRLVFDLLANELAK